MEAEKCLIFLKASYIAANLYFLVYCGCKQNYLTTQRIFCKKNEVCITSSVSGSVLQPSVHPRGGIGISFHPGIGGKLICSL